MDASKERFAALEEERDRLSAAIHNLKLQKAEESIKEEEVNFLLY